MEEELGKKNVMRNVSIVVVSSGFAKRRVGSGWSEEMASGSGWPEKMVSGSG